MLCEVDRSYIEDGFNLYGLKHHFANFQGCLDIILDRTGAPLTPVRKVSDSPALIGSCWVGCGRPRLMESRASENEASVRCFIPSPPAVTSSYAFYPASLSGLDNLTSKHRVAGCCSTNAIVLLILLLLVTANPGVRCAAHAGGVASRLSSSEHLRQREGVRLRFLSECVSPPLDTSIVVTDRNSIRL